MHQKKLALLLLKPSITSGTVCFLLAVAILGLSNYGFIFEDPILEQYIYGQYGIVTSFESLFASFSNFISGFMPNQSTTYNILVLIAAATIGFTTYIILQLATKFLATVLGDYLTVSESGESESKTAVEVGLRWITRLITFAMWIIYWFIFLAVLLPFCILAARFGVNDLLSFTVWATAILSVIILGISFHIHVVFLRLLALRPRLYGGREDIVEALAREYRSK